MTVHPEQQYLEILRNIIENGDHRIDRTGVGTYAITGATMRFDLSDGRVPLLTTKRVYWKTAIREMLWFLSGDTNIQSLLKQNVKIWTDWPLAAYRKKTGHQIEQSVFEDRIVKDDDFAREWGDLGRGTYGGQWRKWKGNDGRVYDQIANVIHLIRTDRFSRRILFHGWNVAEIENAMLPSCHLLYQFTVTKSKSANTSGMAPNKDRLNLVYYMRSNDFYLGQPFNSIGASALLYMIAQQTDLVPGELIYFGTDVHLYANHVEQAREQLTREPRPFPTMKLVRHPDSIDDYRITDFEIEGYDPHPALAAPVAI